MEAKIAKILLDAKAVALSLQKPFTYTSGIKSPIYCDNRILISYPEFRKQIVDGFLEKLKGLDFDVVAGTATAGIPWAAWIADALGKPLVYIRGKAKEHGKGNQIEGTFEGGAKVVIIEDLISTAGSLVNAIEAVRETGGIVTDSVAIFTYGLLKGKDRMDAVDCRCITLSNFEALVSVAVSENIISSDDEKTVLSWNQDPEGWGASQ